MLSLYFCRTVRVDCPVFIWRHTMKEQKIKVLALLPMELPKEIELDNTLEAMQNFVGGLIECITFANNAITYLYLKQCDFKPHFRYLLISGQIRQASNACG